MLRARDSLECGWITKNVGQNLIDGVSKDATRQSGVECLADNVLFGQYVFCLIFLFHVYPFTHRRF